MYTENKQVRLETAEITVAKSDDVTFETADSSINADSVNLKRKK